MPITQHPERLSTRRNPRGGYTLIELIVAMGLFAIIMMLASGAYLMMIGLNRQAQGVATGVDNLSFAIETMTRSIRTGTAYSCGVTLGAGDCPGGGGSFTFTDMNGVVVSYSLAAAAIRQTVAGVSSTLTDPTVIVTALTFYVTGTKPTSQGDKQQPHLTVTVSGWVTTGTGKRQYYTVETGATMRGTDI